MLVANGGEAARVVFVARAAHVQSAKVLATLALERMFELVGYVVLLSLAASFLELPHVAVERASRSRSPRSSAMVALLVWLVRRPDVVETVAGRSRRRLARAAQGVRGALRRRRSAGLDGPALHRRAALSASPSGRSRCGRTAHGAARRTSPMTLVGTVAALLAVNLGFALRATPGNVGVFQAAYALTAAAFGMDNNQAIAVAFLIQAQQIIPVTLLGVALAPEFIFKKGQRRASRRARRDSERIARRGGRGTEHDRFAAAVTPPLRWRPLRCAVRARHLDCRL